MGRIRTIKPDFFKHWDLYQAEINSGLPIRLAYSGLWTVADKEGRFRCVPQQLKLEVLPYDEVDFSLVLKTLATGGWVVLYEFEGKSYGWIPTFKDHQRISGSEKDAESKLPEPPPKEPAGSMEEALGKHQGNIEEKIQTTLEKQGDTLKNITDSFSRGSPSNYIGSIMENHGSTLDCRREEEERGKEEELISPPGNFSGKKENEELCYDFKNFLSQRQAVFESICMCLHKSKEQVDYVLEKFHLWNIQNQKYPQHPAQLEAGLKLWLLNEKNAKNGTGTKTTGKGAKDAGALELLAELKQDFSARGNADPAS